MVNESVPAFTVIESQRASLAVVKALNEEQPIAAGDNEFWLRVAETLFYGPSDAPLYPHRFARRRSSVPLFLATCAAFFVAGALGQAVANWLVYGGGL